MNQISFRSGVRDNRLIGTWLLFVMLTVICMIVFGGATRLTNSGLSITEWKPITGALPPLSHEAWLIEFEKYKQIPEFEAEHPDMTLKGFEFIYFMEWGHRQLGRFIGLVYALPLLFFTFRKAVPKFRAWRFWAILILIGVQGAIGWWMVASGLDDVSVSQYRLATHLGMAFVILGLLFWLWRDARENWPKRNMRPNFSKRSGLLAFLIFVQIILGAFVAGTKSGLSYNTWPMMDGRFIPNGYGVMSPIWKNLFENTAAIQFNHRTLAYIILTMTVWVFLTSRKHRFMRGSVTVLSLLILWQVALGIITLLTGSVVHVWTDIHIELALLHQFSSILVFLSVLWVWRNTLVSRA